MSSEDMLETGRRTAISSSELGLYSDRCDRYNRNRYGPVVRKFTIVVMVVVTVVLVLIFLYDFTSATSANNKVNQETKHIYILQNALKKSSNFQRRSGSPTGFPVGNQTSFLSIQDRSDDENHQDLPHFGETPDQIFPGNREQANNPESRAQNFNNFKMRKTMADSSGNSLEVQEPEGKQLFDNHAVIYRVRQRYRYPESEEDTSSEESRPAPFRWEFKTPHPVSFKRTKYPQLSQYRYPHSSRNIQDIIKYLTNDAEIPNRGIKFTGVYVNPKKYDLMPEIGEMMSNSDRSQEDDGRPFAIPFNEDPLYQYKPKHPGDVNLLATSNVRFPPTGIHRYNPYYDPLYPRPVISYNKQPPPIESQFQSPTPYTMNHAAKKRKPKPFSVMLDIYPITDIAEQNKKSSKPRPQIAFDDYEPRRPTQYPRTPQLYAVSPQPIPVVGVPNQQGFNEEDERQQMIFHLNLYPRRKNKLNRYDIIHRSESMAPDERQQFMNKLMSPLETIAKHLTVEESRFQETENSDSTSLPVTRYQETDLEEKGQISNHRSAFFTSSEENIPQESITAPTNHKAIVDDDYASTEKYELDAQRMMETTTMMDSGDRSATLNPDEDNNNNNQKIEEISKDIDTVEGFQQFSDGLLATD